MGPLRWDPWSLVVTGAGVLHVANDGGVVALRGRDIDRLHARLSPHLRGSQTASQLLARVPGQQAAAVRRYLEALQQSGALRDDPPRSVSEGAIDRLWRAAPRARSSSAASTLSGSIAGRPVRIELIARRDDRSRMPADGIAIRFATRRNVARALFSLDECQAECGRDVYVVDRDMRSIGARALSRRADLARWLLWHALVQRTPPHRPDVYEVGAHGTLIRVVAADDEPAVVPERLRLISWVDVPQRPFVVGAAAHAWFGTTVRAYGRSRAEVAPHLLRGFVAREWLRRRRSATPTPCLVGRLDDSRNALAAGERPLGGRRGVQIAATLDDLRLRVLEQIYGASNERAGARTIAMSQDVDFLVLPVTSPLARYVQAVLRVRLARLRGRITQSADGLWTVCSGRRRHVSLVRERALLGVLADVAWRIFYGRSALRRIETAGCDASILLGDAERASIVRNHAAALRRRGVDARLWAREIRQWGVSTWIGGAV